MTLVDTHCHLNDLQAFPVPEVAVNEASEAGVERLIVVGVDFESSQIAVGLADRFEQVYAVVGWHPNHASQYSEEGLASVKGLLAHPKVVALGEIGLDYFRDHATREEQHRCLLEQLDLAEESGVPVVFHCRDAYPDLLDVLEQRRPGKFLFHCFAGSHTDAQRATALDAWFGVDGPVTYKSADDLRTTLKSLDPAKILIETDAPWMSPVPYRGQRNKPAWVTFVNAALSETLGMTPETCADLTTRNAQAFFGDLSL
jgi:TatD DNase family protein